MDKKILKAIGPIVLSALSLFLTFIIVQPIALCLEPSFDLLSSRGIGKINFIGLIILQIFLLFSLFPRKFLNKLLQTNIYFFKEKHCIKRFFSYFIIFFALHWLVLFSVYLAGYVQYNPDWGIFGTKLIARTAFGFVATFFLAWTEELIFRGTLFQYFQQYITNFSAVILTSAIFMFAHNLTNPLDLVTTNWQLGLGLFLLGTLLNLVFFDTKKLYTGMGLHAGLVFVKVVLRRAPFLVFLPAAQLHFCVNKDLRMAPITHVSFFIVILFLIIKNKKALFNKAT